ncbi:hypothetical protein HPB52_018138 [Rhipicephalus sanguineus]|uniref:Uncharacterized protein n=1 Tax=Rhipicephalus sanguineus TaxID=34632 RepID=A0A9D4PK54_RHISA|nr:hypothetical protein HPB52_018138 [Rhipicephalus sanguineus]
MLDLRTVEQRRKGLHKRVSRVDLPFPMVYEGFDVDAPRPAIRAAWSARAGRGSRSTVDATLSWYVHATPVHRRPEDEREITVDEREITGDERQNIAEDMATDNAGGVRAIHLEDASSSTTGTRRGRKRCICGRLPPCTSSSHGAPDNVDAGSSASKMSTSTLTSSAPPVGPSFPLAPMEVSSQMLYEEGSDDEERARYLADGMER